MNRAHRWTGTTHCGPAERGLRTSFAATCRPSTATGPARDAPSPRCSTRSAAARRRSHRRLPEPRGLRRKGARVPRLSLTGCRWSGSASAAPMGTPLTLPNGKRPCTSPRAASERGAHGRTSGLPTRPMSLGESGWRPALTTGARSPERLRRRWGTRPSSGAGSAPTPEARPAAAPTIAGSCPSWKRLRLERPAPGPPARRSVRRTARSPAGRGRCRPPDRGARWQVGCRSRRGRAVASRPPCRGG